MENRIIVASFDNESAAFEAAQHVQDLDQSGAIKVKRAAILTKDDNGNFTIPDAKFTGSSLGPLGGGVLGTLAGALGALLSGPAGTAGILGGAAAGMPAGATGDAFSDAVRLDQADQYLHGVGSEIESGQTVLLAELDGEDEEAAELIETAVTSRGGRVFQASRELGPFEGVQQRVERDLTREAATVENKIEADAAERDRLHDDLKQNDINTLNIMTVDQQTKYDVYANSQGPTSTRPLDE